MNRPMFEIGANGIDVGNVVAEIQATVAEKMKNGMFHASVIPINRDPVFQFIFICKNLIIFRINIPQVIP